jgi:hypothetical protein
MELYSRICSDRKHFTLQTVNNNHNTIDGHTNRTADKATLRHCDIALLTGMLLLFVFRFLFKGNADLWHNKMSDVGANLAPFNTGS